MVTRDQIIDYVFRNVEDLLFDGIKNNDDKAVVEEGYKHRIDNVISDTLLKVPNIEDEKISWFLLNIQEQDWLLFKLSPQQRIDKFKIGPLIDVLKLYRNLAHQLAIHYLNNEVVPENLAEKKNDILNYMGGLKDSFCGREDLESFYNEMFEQALLDLDFAGGNSNKISMKIADILDEKSLLSNYIQNTGRW